MLLGFGALIAANEQKMLTWFARVPPLVAICLLALAGLWMGLAPGLLQVVTGLLVPFAIIVGMFALPAASPLARRLLASWPLRTVGLYSYTLYLWQQLALTHQPLIPPMIGLGLALAFSVLSYHTLERAARDLARRASQGLAGRNAGMAPAIAKAP
jgi:peptidoglycan/LPS O-acetylase OafA/YrhL